MKNKKKETKMSLCQKKKYTTLFFCFGSSKTFSLPHSHFLFLTGRVVPVTSSTLPTSFFQPLGEPVKWLARSNFNKSKFSKFSLTNTHCHHFSCSYSSLVDLVHVSEKSVFYFPKNNFFRK